MKTNYIDGVRFRRGFNAGCKAVLEAQDYLNSINVFPVADGDTGINMAMTLQAVMNHGYTGKGLKDTLRAVADAALTGARGNSGIIIAQYLHGLYRELPETVRVSAAQFAASAKKAVDHMYESILKPVEGTVLTVIREWADHLLKHSNADSNVTDLLSSSLTTARNSLAETPSRLAVLADAGVVDAGASGFVLFLEGLVDYIAHGSVRDAQLQVTLSIPQTQGHDHPGAPGQNRYCAEAILQDCTLPLGELKQRFSGMGDSLILAGGADKIHIHIHTNQPFEFYRQLHDLGKVQGSKVDDMLLIR